MNFLNPGDLVYIPQDVWLHGKNAGTTQKPTMAILLEESKSDDGWYVFIEGQKKKVAKKHIYPMGEMHVS